MPVIYVFNMIYIYSIFKWHIFNIHIVINSSGQNHWNKIFYHIKTISFWNVTNSKNCCILISVFTFEKLSKRLVSTKLFHYIKTAFKFFYRESCSIKNILTSFSQSGNRGAHVICWNVLQSLQRAWMISLSG